MTNATRRGIIKTIKGGDLPPERGITMAKKTITVSGKKYTRTGIRISPDDKAAYDAFLATLPTNTCIELTISARDQRQEWIDSHYNEAITASQSLDTYDDTNIAHIKFCKDVTIFIRHWIDTDDYIGVAAPRHGDKYDRKTGIAVAYAKAMGEAVPDYI